MRLRTWPLLRLWLQSSKGKTVVIKAKGRCLRPPARQEVTGKEVAEALAALAGSPIDKKKIELETKDIKDAGVFNGKVRLHVGRRGFLQDPGGSGTGLIFSAICAPPHSRGALFGFYDALKKDKLPCRTNDIIQRTESGERGHQSAVQYAGRAERAGRGAAQARDID